MKKLILPLLLIGSGLAAQTPINKSIPVQAGQKIDMHFDYPDLIRVSTWDKNEIQIQGTVSINAGENDDAFELITATTGNMITIKNEIHNLKSLPQRITVTQGGEKIVFKTRADYKKWQEQNGKEGNSVGLSTGTDMDIFIEIKVPRNTDTHVEAVYGMVEIRAFTGPLRVEATYGGVDVALTEGSTGQLTAETNYGQIYTNLETKFFNGDIREEDFHTVVSAKPGNGPSCSFESKYGNVYLRKP